MDLILDHETIKLWPGDAPYTQDSPGQRQPSLLPYPVDGAKGAVVICPGGGYCMKADHEGRDIAKMLNEAGVAAYVLDYRVKPCHYEAPLSDAKRAIRLVRSMGYEKVAILGFSAGGHLCCAAATLYDAGDPEADDPIERISSRPDGFIPCYAVVSFTSFRHQGSVENLLGDKAQDYALLRRFSAELNVTGDTPPGFIWHSCGDQLVPVENSIQLAKAMAEAGAPFELHIFPGGCHGAGVASPDENAEKWAPMSLAWLKSLGF